MLFAIDVGNTNTVFGLFPSVTDRSLHTRPGENLRHHWRMSSVRERTADEWFALLSPLLQSAQVATSSIDAVVIGSVVPAVTSWLTQMCRSHLHHEPVIVSSASDVGIGIEIDNPSEIGADRLANAVAVGAYFSVPAIVVDFGTATTFDVISERGSYIGGAIAPGPAVALDALTSRAARLRSIDMTFPDHAIGTSTVAAVKSGTVLGYLALVEGMIARIQNELPSTAEILVTGGHGQLFARASPLLAHYEPHLTLEGLRLILMRAIHPRAADES